MDAAGWVSARAIELARSKTGVSRAALNRARRWLQQTGDIEKRRRGYQGPWMYRVVASKSRHCPVCGAVNGVPATVPVEPVPTAEPAQPAVAIRYLGRRSWYTDGLYGTGLIWHGPGDIQPLADRDTAHDAWPRITRTSTSSSRLSRTDRVRAPEPRQTNGATKPDPTVNR